MESSSIQFAGPPCGHHGPYTFYRAFKYKKKEEIKTVSIGEFFFAKISQDAAVCIGELQLVWSDRNSGQYLSSIKLYFLPDHTPDGRQDHHGEDEVLAESEKVILRLDDLLSWILDDVDWPIGTLAYSKNGGLNERSTDAENIVSKFAVNNAGLSIEDSDKQKTLDDTKKCGSEVMVISYPQYCRFKAVLKRLENLTDKWLKSAIVSAIGGFTVGAAECRVLFCRDALDHPLLQDHEARCDHLAPNLKGRPRKRKNKVKKDQESSDSTEEEWTIQSESSENMATSPKSRPNPRKKTTKIEKSDMAPKEQDFIAKLYKFMKRRNTPIGRIPSLGFKQLDLFFFYNFVQKLGGYEQVTERRFWKHIYDKLGGNPGSTSAATCTRRHYEKLLLPYERYQKGSEHLPLPKPYIHPKSRSNHGDDEQSFTDDLEEEMVEKVEMKNSVLNKKKQRLMLEPSVQKKFLQEKQVNNVHKEEIKRMSPSMVLMNKTVKTELAITTPMPQHSLPSTDQSAEKVTLSNKHSGNVTHKNSSLPPAPSVLGTNIKSSNQVSKVKNSSYRLNVPPVRGSSYASHLTNPVLELKKNPPITGNDTEVDGCLDLSKTAVAKSVPISESSENAQPQDLSVKIVGKAGNDEKSDRPTNYQHIQRNGTSIMSPLMLKKSHASLAGIGGSLFASPPGGSSRSHSQSSSSGNARHHNLHHRMSSNTHQAANSPSSQIVSHRPSVIQHVSHNRSYHHHLGNSPQQTSSSSSSSASPLLHSSALDGSAQHSSIYLTQAHSKKENVAVHKRVYPFSDNMSASSNNHQHLHSPHVLLQGKPSNHRETPKLNIKDLDPYFESVKRQRIEVANSGQFYTSKMKMFLQGSTSEEHSPNGNTNDQPTDLSIKNSHQVAGPIRSDGTLRGTSSHASDRPLSLVSKAKKRESDSDSPLPLVSKAGHSYNDQSSKRSSSLSSSFSSSSSSSLMSSGNSTILQQPQIPQGVTPHKRELSQTPSPQLPYHIKSLNPYRPYAQVASPVPEGRHTPQRGTPSPQLQRQDANKSSKVPKPSDDAVVHPAFPPLHALPGQGLPSNLFPSPIHLQLYEAYKDLMRPMMMSHPHPYVIPPNHLYPHLYSSEKSPRFTHQK